MYVELHARSAFSFLEATALPEDLAEQAARLEQPAIALADSDGVYGAARFYRACTRLGLAPLVGAEVTLETGGRLPLLVEDREGYRNLCRLLTRIKMRAPKGEGAATRRSGRACRGARLPDRRRPRPGRGAPGLFRLVLRAQPPRTAHRHLRALRRLHRAPAPSEPRRGSA